MIRYSLIFTTKEVNIKNLTSGREKLVEMENLPTSLLCRREFDHIDKYLAKTTILEVWESDPFNLWFKYG